MPKTIDKLTLKETVKSRSVVPIPSTIEPIKGYPNKLIIFKIPASDFYWTRYYDGKPLKRSTKTTSKAEAIRFAKAFYDEIQVNKKLGISNNKRKTSFLICADGVIEEDKLKAQRDELSSYYIKTQEQLISKHIKDFFKRYEISDVDYLVLEKFKTYLYEKKLASSSIKIHFVCLSKIFKHAQRNKFITAAPLLPSVKTEDNARGYFTLAEYKLLRKTAKAMIGKVFEVRQKATVGDEEVTKKLRNVVITEEICYLLPFMLYTFIRPSDIKTIKHKHIEVRQEKNNNALYDYLFLPIPETKKHSKPLVSMPKAAYYYRKLLALRIGKTKESLADTYLFQSTNKNRDYAYKMITRQFDAIVETAQLKYSDEGDSRTMYSMRHSALMYRLKYGEEISPIKLANNARTSVEMLTRFYLPQLPNLDIVRDLHARKEPKRRKLERSVFVEAPQLLDLTNLSKSLDSRTLRVENGNILVDEQKSNVIN